MSDSAGMNATTPNHGSDDLPSIGRFPAYPAYRDSGVPWLGQVPAHWEVKRLKDIGTLVGGARFPHEEQGREGEELPFYKVADLARAEDGRTMGDAKSTISRETASRLRARIIPANSIVYAKIGAALLLNRRRITTKPCCIDNNMTAFTPALKWLSTLWAWYWLSIIDFEQVANPGAVPSFSEGDQASLPIALPDLYEQRAITAFLDRECGKMDALMAEQEQLIALLKEKRQAIISHAVTKGLDPTAPMKDSGATWIGYMPAAWTVLPLKRLAQTCTERATTRSFPVGLEHIESWSGRLIHRETQFEGDGTLFQRGDILFGKLRPYLAKVWLADRTGEAVGDFYVIRTGLQYEPEFLQYVLLSRDVISLIDGSTYGAKMPRSDWEFIGSLPMPLPSLAEQRAIAAFLDSECGRIDALIAEAETMISLLRERRSALISAAVTGQIDVRILSGPS
jgi:type I restriction enzyme S subunit